MPTGSSRNGAGPHEPDRPSQAGAAPALESVITDGPFHLSMIEHLANEMFKAVPEAFCLVWLEMSRCRPRSPRKSCNGRTEPTPRTGPTPSIGHTRWTSDEPSRHLRLRGHGRRRPDIDALIVALRQLATRSVAALNGPASSCLRGGGHQ